MSDFQPNPLHVYGRIDTSAGENGEHLHKVNPTVFGVVEGHIGRGAEVDGPGDPEAIELAASMGQVESGEVASPTIVVDLGTVDTSGPEGAHVPSSEQVENASAVALGVDVPQPVTADEADQEPVVVNAGAEVAEGSGEAVSPNSGEEAPDTSTWSPEPEEGYESLTGEQLKDELRTRGLKVSGSKEELIERLRESNAQYLA